jgi:hypothetical protein
MFAAGKGTYVHSPFLCVAISNLIAPSFGLPFVTASLPHSPQFVLALTDTGKKTNNDNCAQGYKAVTVENRVAPLLVYFLIGLVSFVPSVVRCIPLGNFEDICPAICSWQADFHNCSMTSNAMDLSVFVSSCLVLLSCFVSSCLVLSYHFFLVDGMVCMQVLSEGF